MLGSAEEETLDFFTLDFVSARHRDWEMEIKGKKKALILQTLGQDFNITCSSLQTQEEPDWVSPNILSPAAAAVADSPVLRTIC